MNATAVNTNTALRLQKMDLSSLKEEAKRLGVPGDFEDKAELIAAIIEAGVSDAGSLEPYILIPLHTQDEEATNLVLKIRNHIVNNEAAGHRIKLYQKNAEGNVYSRFVYGTGLDKAAFERLAEVSAAPFPDQEEMLDDALEHPEAYEKPLAVRISKRNKDGKGNRTFVMLALRKKSKVVASDFSL